MRGCSPSDAAPGRAPRVRFFCDERDLVERRACSPLSCPRESQLQRIRAEVEQHRARERLAARAVEPRFDIDTRSPVRVGRHAQGRRRLSPRPPFRPRW